MSRRPARFTEADLYRAAKAAQRAGMVVEAMKDGTIRLVPPTKLPESQDNYPDLETVPPRVF
jgi:hypothetical protein